jgi:hypothetical protein
MGQKRHYSMGDLSASMKFQTRPRIPLKIKAQHRVFALCILTVYIIYALQSYAKINTPKENIEMMPLIFPGQTIYLYQHDDPQDYQVGDILWYRQKNASSFQWGELVAVAGDQMRIENGRVTREQKILPISNLPANLSKSYPVVQEHHWFIIHHNQESSLSDSLVLGELPMTELKVKGKFFFNPANFRK